MVVFLMCVLWCTFFCQGYAREQCEAWLGAIKEKYKELEQDPLYWECLAALEETVGHISTAVEYYKTAIVHGAEVNLFCLQNCKTQVFALCF